MAAILIALGRAVELADPDILAELVERSVERDGPEPQLAGGELEDVTDDPRAVPIALGERKENEEPVSSHVGGHGRLYSTV